MSIVKRVAHVLIIVSPGRGSELAAGATLSGRRSKERTALSISGSVGTCSSIEMENIGPSMDGSQIVAVMISTRLQRVRAPAGPSDSIRLDKPVTSCAARDTWSLSKLVWQETEADRSGEQPIVIDDRHLRRIVIVESPVGTSGIELQAFEHLVPSSRSNEPVRHPSKSHVSFRGRTGAALNALSGGRGQGRHDFRRSWRCARRKPRCLRRRDPELLTKPVFNLQISSDKLSVPEIAQLVPALAGIRLQPSFNVKADGPLDRLASR
jgi:hypothetical protein